MPHRNRQEAEKDAADRASIVAALERQLAKGDKALVGNTGYRRRLADTVVLYDRAGARAPVGDAQPRTRARARTENARGTRKTLIVALARKLLIALWRLVRDGATPSCCGKDTFG
jgi:hypothetical protein